MTRVCEKYRERALQDGLNSRAGEIWRRHGRNCPGCRAEIYLLSILGESVSDSRQHICRKDYERLLKEVREHSANSRFWGRAGRRLWNIHSVGQAAAILVVLFCIAVSGSWSGYFLWSRNDNDTPMDQLVAIAGREGLFTGSGLFAMGETPGVYSVPDEQTSDILDDGMMLNSRIDRAFFELRNDVEEQSLFYSDMIDREFQE